MNKKRQLSVLLPFRNQRDKVEPTLDALYALKDLALEIILMDDASSDGTGEVIHSLLDYYQHEQSFFFEHDQPAGRGNCLNEALWQANSPIIWAPESVQKVEEERLFATLKKIKNSSAPCLIQQYDLPMDSKTWTERIMEGKLPRDAQLLWNRRNMNGRDQFFNPFLRACNGTEWLLRLGMDTLQQSEPFFTVSAFEESFDLAPADRQELMMSLLRRPNLSSEERRNITELLLDLPAISQNVSKTDHDLLETAVKQKMEGQLSNALETVEKVLQKEPRNAEANHLKIKLLESKRRFVEASELKHRMQIKAKPGLQHSTVEDSAITTSLIIPTALYGKPALEHLLLSLDDYGRPSTTELIIIDNASLDDTHDYLDELQEQNFFNCRIITNRWNQGFAASVNQGLEAARGDYACIIHNDVAFEQPCISRLEQLMEAHPEFALIGPLANSTLNPDQLSSARGMYKQELEPVDFIDSFCMMLRMDTGLRMDDSYELAFFEDIDLCFEARKQGFKVGITPEVELKHHYGRTTFALDLDTESELYWKNIAYFNQKWGIQTYSEEEMQTKGRFQQLLTLDEWINPMFPEAVMMQKFDELFTDEVKTEILKTSHEPETLLQLIHLLMVMEKREVMRRLEDRAEDIEMPGMLIYELVRFYFNRNVYSRCQHYLNRLTSQQELLRADLYRLAILIDEKKMEEAIPLLTKLMDKAPANPRLYQLAGHIHAFENNREEAESFYKLAHQINPFDFSNDEHKAPLSS